MNTIANFSFETSPLAEGILLLSQTIRTDFPLADVRHQLKQLADEAQAVIPKDIDKNQQTKKLINLFFQQWKFRAAGGTYRLSDAIWLDTVLVKRQGAAVALAAIFLYVARALDLPLIPVLFPEQLILRADWLDEEIWLINPLNGDTLDEHTLEVWIRSHFGAQAELEEDDLEGANNLHIVHNMLDTLKAALIEEEQMELALRTSEALLLFDPEDPYEIRDRGLIYAQLACNHIAISDLSYFVEHCPEDPITGIIKMHISTMKKLVITVH